MFNKAAATLFHLAPIVPFALGYVYSGIAMILLVGLAYIKTNKLLAVLREMDQQTKDTGRTDPEQRRSVENAMNFWRGLTFLRESRP